MINTAQIITLTKRDTAIILMVYMYFGCSTNHVARLLFPGSKSPRACYRHIAHLLQKGYLLSQRLPSSSGIGSGKNFLTVGPKGRPVVAHTLGLPLSEVARSRADAPRFIEHHLAICDSRVKFEVAVEHSDIFSLVEWTRDRAMDIKVKDTDGKELVLTPDGAFTLALPDGRRQQFFLEQDTGSMTNSKRMRVRLAGYLAYSRLTQVPVVFVTTTRQRLEAIANLALEEAKELGVSPSTIWLTTNDQLTEISALASPIWHVVGIPSSMSLSRLALLHTVDGIAPNASQQLASVLKEALNVPESVPTASLTVPGGYEV